MQTMSTSSIYVAEDHISIRELLCQHLEMMGGYKVIGQTDDGGEAYRNCSQLRPDILLLDLNLRGMNGFDVMTRFTESGVSQRILVFSSHVDAATVRRSMELGAKGIVEKSAPFTILLEGLKAVIGGQSFLSDLASEALRDSLKTPGPSTPLMDLTPREIEVLKLVAEGKSNKEVAVELNIRLKTAENHRHNLMNKLGARNAADLTREAYRIGVVALSGATTENGYFA